MTHAHQPLTALSMEILLALAEGALHGYAIMQQLELQTDGALTPGTGTLYAALQRMMDEDLIAEATNLPGPNEDQRRRYYRITEKGRNAVALEARRLKRVLELASERNLAEGRA